jgi:hypothetical protein
MPQSRCDFAASAVGSDIFVFGGCDRMGDGQNSYGSQDSVYTYDTVANDWRTLTPMPYPCSEHGASVLDGLIYLVGAGGSRREVMRFESVSGAWSTLAPTLQRRRSSASFAVAGCLYAVGGLSGRMNIVSVTLGRP